MLLIDDTWTTGASAQSAAAALKDAGAGRVAAVVIGRHLNREWHENDRRLRGIERPFDWSKCALCAEPDSAQPPATVAYKAAKPPRTAALQGHKHPHMLMSTRQAAARCHDCSGLS